MPIRLLGKTDGAGLANSFQSRGDVDAIAHQIAIALLDHIAEMDADAELDAALGRKAGVALDRAVLHLDRAAHGVDDAAKLDEEAVAGALHNTPVMRSNGGIDQIAPQPPEPRQGAILVGAGKLAVSDHIGGENRGEFPGLGHEVFRQRSKLAQRPVQDRPVLTEIPSYRYRTSDVAYWPFSAGSRFDG